MCVCLFVDFVTESAQTDRQTRTPEYVSELGLATRHDRESLKFANFKSTPIIFSSTTYRPRMSRPEHEAPPEIVRNNAAPVDV